MNIKKFFILILIFSVICSINIISANDLTVVEDSVGGDLNEKFDENSLEISEEDTSYSETAEDFNCNDDVSSPLNSQSMEISSSAEDYIIYVGKNSTENGNGSSGNPYANFDLACNDVKDGKDNVIINVEEGTYYLGSVLSFNVNNLHINGSSGNVIIKNKENKQGAFQYFNLTSNGNFTMTNIIVDGSDWTMGNHVDFYPLEQSFYIFNGDANLVTFNNCTFRNLYGMLPTHWDDTIDDISFDSEPYMFNKCNFIYDKIGNEEYMLGLLVRDVTFKNCCFNFKFGDTYPPFSQGQSGKDYGHNTIFEDCWLGVNYLPFIFYDDLTNEYAGYDINRYAIFSISENYLGNNTHEIIGKLMWNDSTDDGFENLNPMKVILSSDTGDFNQTTAILENGTFKVIYTSNSSNHKVTATLDNAQESVVFESIPISLDRPTIIPGDDQNITITLPNEYNGVIYVTVNNKTYNKTVTLTNSVIINIPDALPIGTHEVIVNFVDKIDTPTCPIYGFNKTTMTISKINSYIFNVSQIIGDVKVGDKKIITITLPDDANGNVSVYVGKNNFTETVTGNMTLVEISGFVAGENTIKVVYSDEIYAEKTIETTINVDKKSAEVTNTTFVVDLNDVSSPSVTINLPKDATGKLSVVLNGKIMYVPVDLVNGSATINISDLVAGTYSATISYSGDEAYNPITKTVNITVSEPTKPNTPTDNNNKNPTSNDKKITKVATKITAKNKTFKAKTKVKKYAITLKTKAGKAVKMVQVTIKIGKKTYKATTNAKGKATFKIKKLTKKAKYTATIKFKGNANYKAVTKKVKITIKK